MHGFGGMISLDLATDLAGARRFLEQVQIFALAESLGGVESLIEHPAIMTHATIPEQTRAQLGIGDALVRLSRRKQVERAWQQTLANQPQRIAPSEEHQALILETLGQLQAMLERLPAPVAEAFCLAQLQGLNYRQIATQLGVSERTVTKYMAQAMLQCLLLEVELDGALL
uniref:cystathionine gamma-lyase n=1 Tax=Steinernema glaseri TaxID=37863 RepID=A0A1I8AFF5_9BILA